MQRTQFHAKSAKNDLKPTDFLNCNFYFETEGVVDIETTFLLPRYTTTLRERLTQTLNEPCPLGQKYQGLIKFIITKYNGAEHLPLLKAQA
jgi:hypothetical protein